jgi:hypothetical protein
LDWWRRASTNARSERVSASCIVAIVVARGWRVREEQPGRSQSKDGGGGRLASRSKLESSSIATAVTSAAVSTSIAPFIGPPLSRRVELRANEWNDPQLHFHTQPLKPGLLCAETSN